LVFRQIGTYLFVIVFKVNSYGTWCRYTVSFKHTVSLTHDRIVVYICCSQYVCFPQNWFWVCNLSVIIKYRKYFVQICGQWQSRNFLIMCSTVKSVSSERNILPWTCNYREEKNERMGQTFIIIVVAHFVILMSNNNIYDMIVLYYCYTYIVWLI